MLKIKRVRGKRFLSIGDEPIEVDYQSLGQVVHIKGVNHDSGGSNGSGKSLLLEMIICGFTGKLLKGLNHKQMVNRRFKGGMELDIDFDLPGVGSCSISRRRESATKGSLSFMAGGKEYDLGLSETQEEITRATGITYEALANMAFFGQHNKFAFLTCDSETKRKIVETMLGLEKYGKRHKIIKERRRDLEKEIKRSAASYEEWLNAAGAAKARLSQAMEQQKSWNIKVARDIETLEETIRGVESSLFQSDACRKQEEYDNVLAEMTEVRAKLDSYMSVMEKLEAKHAEFSARHKDASAVASAALDRSKDAERAKRTAEMSLATARRELAEAVALEEGVKCGQCRQTITKDGQLHFCESQERKIADLVAELDALTVVARDAKATHEEARVAVDEALDKIELAVSRRDALSKSIREAQRRFKDLSSVPRPDTEAEFNAGKERIASLRGKLEALEAAREGGNPYDSAVRSASAEVNEASIKVADYKEFTKGQEAMLPYYDYWIEGFGDNGIRSMVIEDILPALNKRIEYWLQILMDGRLSLTFESAAMAERLECRPSDGNPFVHNALSGGEHQCIDLALSQSFAHMAAMSYGVTASNLPSIIALDEVAAHVDEVGVRAVYRMINELAKERQVLVITHDKDLQDMLAEADQLVVEKRDGISTLRR